MKRMPQPLAEAAGNPLPTALKYIAIAALVVILSPVILLLLIMADEFVGMLLIPLDDDLIEILDTKESKLTRAVELAQQVGISAATFPGSEDGDSREMAELKSVLDDLDVEFVMTDGCLQFVFDTGPALSYEYKGLSWCGIGWKPEPGVDRLVEITDPYHNSSAAEKYEINPEYDSEGSIYRHLRGDWYIRYQSLYWG